MSEFTATAPAMTFGKIRWDRDRCTTNLRSQPVLLFLRPIAHFAVGGRHQIHCFLPGNQILVSLLPNLACPAIPSSSIIHIVLLRYSVCGGACGDTP